MPSNRAAAVATAAKCRLVSIRRTDLCAFERRWLECGNAPLKFQSVERICVPSNTRSKRQWHSPKAFQSVERICVPSNVGEPDEAERFCRFQSVERICVPSNPITCFQSPTFSSVSIRRTDLCAFEHGQIRINGKLYKGFNPSNGFVCLRTQAVAARTENKELFQSVERICVPSNDLC